MFTADRILYSLNVSSTQRKEHTQKKQTTASESGGNGKQMGEREN